MDPYFAQTNLIMVYLLGATIAALRLGRGPSCVVAVINVLAFDFFFVPPRYSFAVEDLQYVVTFGVMLAVAVIIATLVASVRAQTLAAEARERQTSRLYAMSQELSCTQSMQELADVAVRHLAETFAVNAVVLLPDSAGRLLSPEVPAGGALPAGADLSVAQRVLDQEGAGADERRIEHDLDVLYLPLGGGRKASGVLAVRSMSPACPLSRERRQLLERFAAQIALTLERAQLQEDAQQSRIAAETESIRNTLLASISHDLRTPLAVIEGASSALSDAQMNFDAEARRSLLAQIALKSREMSEIITNVLNMMRVESGQLSLRLDWVSVDDLVNTAVARQAAHLINHPLDTCLAEDLPVIRVDGSLLLQLLVNLLDNVAKHTPPGTPIRITGGLEGPSLWLAVDDTGPGLPPGDPEELFAKFHRGHDERSRTGVGLGLSICRAIARAHGGHIQASQRDGGGARFLVTIPVD